MFIKKLLLMVYYTNVKNLQYKPNRSHRKPSCLLEGKRFLAETDSQEQRDRIISAMVDHFAVQRLDGSVRS